MALSLVPERGLEPPLPCGNQVLNLARLPIPPFGLCGVETHPFCGRRRYSVNAIIAKTKMNSMPVVLSHGG
jgi:hypothetical protein